MQIERVAICSRWLAYRALWLPLYSPLACKAPILSLLVSGLGSILAFSLPSFLLPSSNLSTSGQPHLLAYPQDINRIQRLIPVHLRTHRCVIYICATNINRSKTSIGFAECERSHVKCEKCEATDFAENSELERGSEYPG